jgi:endonuclease/exonuclease/phosphatase family metal-dependent hydrolase
VVCGDAQNDGNAKFLIEFVNIIRKSSHPTLIVGDFNMTREERVIKINVGLQ